ncbi:hypothetical protein R1flu_012082 [Riccia fluitans]|uniref:rhamnogalacturonan endolyase n=1 Tax=Riccia fluitans TaxID=41844 RepID=A0ABD1ZAJ4_9MARC
MTSSAPPVRFTDKGDKVAVENGIVKVILLKPAGLVSAISYGGLDNLLETGKSEHHRGYWDLNWSEPDGRDIFYVPFGAEFRLIYSSDDKVEVSFLRTYVPNPDLQSPVCPLTIDKRFVLLRGSPGFYSYGIYEHGGGWRDFNLNQTRIVFMLCKKKFNYMALDDKKLRLMPSPDDLAHNRSEELAYKEARLITDPVTDPSLKGEVDDKYQYSCDNKDNKVHGWISKNHMIGFWMVTASSEFRNGGPTKQNLTSHTGPACLSMFHSAHYAGISLCPQFRNGEAWKKVFGPVFIYLNSRPGRTDVRELWEDAKYRMLEEVNSWPYNWPCSSDYPKADERGQVSGRILVSDKYATNKLCSGSNAYVGLALPGEEGSWQRESKGYQFWTQADKKGYFCLKNVRAGTYDIFGWVPGVVGDYKKEGDPIAINPGDDLQLGGLVYNAPRYGPTVWEIGYPDRTALGYVPDPDPRYFNRLYVDFEKYRNYGLWARYIELYPEEDLIYTVGTSDWSKDWFFSHVARRNPSDGKYSPAVWQIRFQLSDFDPTHGSYKFRMAIATSNQAAIQVKVNDPISKAIFDTHGIGKDNSIARHGNHGIYMLFEIDVPAESLRQGDNTIYLNQRVATSFLNGVMYDYLRLEAPPR